MLALADFANNYHWLMASLLWCFMKAMTATVSADMAESYLRAQGMCTGPVHRSSSGGALLQVICICISCGTPSSSRHQPSADH